MTHADDPASRQRFLLEAEVTGGLEHPGIVPVYGLGTYGDGRPYYAMRFIRGDSLKEAIEHFHADAALQTDPGRRSLELHKLLRRFIDVCNAIDYAHSRGVLHRDIKPGNVLVGKHGETLIVDWGLAKPTGQSDARSDERTLRPSSASGSAETLPGNALGTPAYMSPEQAEGDLDRLGPRSDVYSLGATLYCLLTGRPPFEGDDIGGILRGVQRGDFRPPRTIDPATDRALEAVCLKAMALKPEDRYGSCRALAEDVERWMADEPVSAWREPFSRRVRRWARRNRTAVAAALVALVAGVVGLGAVAGVQARANHALQEGQQCHETGPRRGQGGQASDRRSPGAVGGVAAAGRGGQHLPRRRVPQPGPRTHRPGGQGGGCHGPGQRPARQGVRRVAGDQGGAPGSPGPNLHEPGAVRQGREPARQEHAPSARRRWAPTTPIRSRAAATWPAPMQAPAGPPRRSRCMRRRSSSARPGWAPTTPTRSRAAGNPGQRLRDRRPDLRGDRAA